VLRLCFKSILITEKKEEIASDKNKEVKWQVRTCCSYREQNKEDQECLDDREAPKMFGIEIKQKEKMKAESWENEKQESDQAKQWRLLLPGVCWRFWGVMSIPCEECREWAYEECADLGQSDYYYCDDCSNK
jgi:hypothetical protein